MLKSNNNYYDADIMFISRKDAMDLTLEAMDSKPEYRLYKALQESTIDQASVLQILETFYNSNLSVQELKNILEMLGLAGQIELGNDFITKLSLKTEIELELRLHFSKILLLNASIDDSSLMNTYVFVGENVSIEIDSINQIKRILDEIARLGLVVRGDKIIDQVNDVNLRYVLRNHYFRQLAVNPNLTVEQTTRYYWEFQPQLMFKNSVEHVDVLLDQRNYEDFKIIFIEQIEYLLAHGDEKEILDYLSFIQRKLETQAGDKMSKEFSKLISLFIYTVFEEVEKIYSGFSMNRNYEKGWKLMELVNTIRASLKESDEVRKDRLGYDFILSNSENFIGNNYIDIVSDHYMNLMQQMAIPFRQILSNAYSNSSDSLIEVTENESMLTEISGYLDRIISLQSRNMIKEFQLKRILEPIVGTFDRFYLNTGLPSGLQQLLDGKFEQNLEFKRIYEETRSIYVAV